MSEFHQKSIERHLIPNDVDAAINEAEQRTSVGTSGNPCESLLVQIAAYSLTATEQSIRRYYGSRGNQ